MKKKKVYYDVTIAFSTPLWASTVFGVTIDVAVSFYHKLCLFHLTLHSSSSQFVFVFVEGFRVSKLNAARTIMLCRRTRKMELRLIGPKLLEISTDYCNTINIPREKRSNEFKAGDGVNKKHVGEQHHRKCIGSWMTKEMETKKCCDLSQFISISRVRFSLFILFKKLATLRSPIDCFNSEWCYRKGFHRERNHEIIFKKMKQLI